MKHEMKETTFKTDKGVTYTIKYQFTDDVLNLYKYIEKNGEKVVEEHEKVVATWYDD